VHENIVSSIILYCLFFVGCLHDQLLLTYGDEHVVSAYNERADETELDKLSDPSG